MYTDSFTLPDDDGHLLASLLRLDGWGLPSDASRAFEPYGSVGPHVRGVRVGVCAFLVVVCHLVFLPG